MAAAAVAADVSVAPLISDIERVPLPELRARATMVVAEIQEIKAKMEKVKEKLTNKRLALEELEPGRIKARYESLGSVPTMERLYKAARKTQRRIWRAEARIDKWTKFKIPMLLSRLRRRKELLHALRIERAFRVMEEQDVWRSGKVHPEDELLTFNDAVDIIHKCLGIASEVFCIKAIPRKIGFKYVDNALDGKRRFQMAWDNPQPNGDTVRAEYEVDEDGGILNLNSGRKSDIFVDAPRKWLVL